MKRGKINISRKSQVTIFIIIAILIVFIITLFFMSRYIGPNPNIPDNIQPIFLSMQECIDKNTEQAIFLIGWGGGYISPPYNSSTVNGIPYYYLNGEILIPSKEKIENQLNNYLNEMLIFCYNDLDTINYQIKFGKINSDTKIEDNKIIFNEEIPLIITNKNKTYSLSNFQSEIPIKIRKILEFSENITKEQIFYSDNICLTCINDKAIEMDLFIEITDYDNETVIITVIDKNSSILNNEFRFNFADKYVR
jgi:hypothetical protein